MGTEPLWTEAEYYLTRAEYHDARRAYLGLVGNARDDRLPVLAPPGGVVAERITAISNGRGWVDAPEYQRTDPRGDLVLEAAALVRTTTPPGATVSTPPSRAALDAYARGKGPKPVATTRVVPDPARVAVLVAAPDLARLPPARVVERGARVPHVDLYPAPTSPDWVGLLAIPTPDRALHGTFLVRRDGAPLVSWEGWKTTPWGREVAVAWAPPRTGAWNAGGNGSTKAVTFGDGASSDVVLVAANHPVVPATALERMREPDAAAPAGLIPVRSRAVVFKDEGLNRATLTSQGWRGEYVEQRNTSLLEHVTQQVTNVAAAASRTVRKATRDVTDASWWQDVARTAATMVRDAGANLDRALHGDLQAAQALAAAALASAVAGPAGATLAASDDPWRDAARIGATYYAFHLSPLTTALKNATAGNVVQPLGGSVAVADAGARSPVRLGAVDLPLERYNVAGIAVTADDLAAAETLMYEVSTLAPDAANALLQRLARNGAYVDLILARLVIEAETDAKKRAALKAELVAKQAEFWQRYGQYLAKGAGLLLSAAGTPALGILAFQIAKTLYQMAVAAQQVEVALEAQHRAELEADRQLRALEAELARLDAALAALDAQDAAAAPPTVANLVLSAAPGDVAATPSAPVDKYWFSWLLRRWGGG